MLFISLLNLTGREWRLFRINYDCLGSTAAVHDGQVSGNLRSSLIGPGSAKSGRNSPRPTTDKGAANAIPHYVRYRTDIRPTGFLESSR